MKVLCKICKTSRIDGYISRRSVKAESFHIHNYIVVDNDYITPTIVAERAMPTKMDGKQGSAKKRAEAWVRELVKGAGA